MDGSYILYLGNVVIPYRPMNKNILLPLSIIIVSIIAGFFLFSSSATDNSLESELKQENLRKVNLEIQNMFCIGCRSSVVGSIVAIPGVIQADADPRTDSGWAIYDPERITKEQIVASSIFQAYPVRILSDQPHIGIAQQEQIAEIPPEIEQKLSILALKLQEREVTLEPFFQEELDDTINRGYWDKANNLLDNFISAYE